MVHLDKFYKARVDLLSTLATLLPSTIYLFMKNTFYSNTKNSYYHSDKNKEFYFLPPELKNTISTSSEDGYSYYKKKYQFWKDKGVFNESDNQIDIQYHLEYIESNIANLRQLLIEVTDGCNLSCQYCGYGELYANYDKREGKKQSFQNVKALIDFLTIFWKSEKNTSFDHIVYIGFYGGEPLLNFSLIQEIIEYVEKIHISGLTFEYNMTTNGVLLGKYMDYLISKKFHLLISLDGSKINNSYRVTSTGVESFDIVVNNAKKIQEYAPDYFEKFVNFNAVLHNRNSVESIYSFIKQTFNKNPSIGELTTNGINKDLKEEFNKMFINRLESLQQAMSCEEVRENYLEISPDRMLMSNFIDAFIGNTYKTLSDLFYNKENLSYMPTSTCPPFYKKLFLTVNGRILPCEKIGQQVSLGWVKDGIVSLNPAEIQDLYESLFNKVSKQCKQCLLWKNCSSCIFFFENNTDKQFHCISFLGKNKADSYFSSYISHLEKEPDMYEEIVNHFLVE